MEESRRDRDPAPQHELRQQDREKRIRTRLLHLDVEVDLRKAILGGLVAAVVSIAGSTMVGQVSGGEGRLLVEAMLPSTRFLCIAVMTASATILALMLTALGLSRNAPTPLRSSHYKRVEQIALFDSATFVLATLLLLILTIPIGESTTLPGEWYTIAYYVVLVLSSLLGGMLISVILMIYGTIRDLVEAIGLEKEDSPLLVSEAEVESDE